MDTLAHALADRIIEREVGRTVDESLTLAVSMEIEKRRRPSRRRPNFPAYYAFLAPYEARFKRGFKKYWDRQARVVIGNMKRTPGGQRAVATAITKGKTFAEMFEQWAFASAAENKKLEVVYRDMATKLLYATASREAGQYNLSVSWDVFNDNIGTWLDGYAINLSGEVNMTTLDKLKATLYEGWQAGESIGDLTNRVRDTYEEFERYRAEMIARSESIRASNQGSLETYRASGVVDRAMWVATPEERTCETCLGLDGKTVKLGEPFPFDDTYGDGSGPPAHPNCRCTIVPILEGEDL